MTTTTASSSSFRLVKVSGVWTYDLSPMPSLLVSHNVPEDIWRETYESVIHQNSSLSHLHSFRNKLRWFLMFVFNALVIVLLNLCNIPDGGSFLFIILPFASTLLAFKFGHVITKSDEAKVLSAWKTFVNGQQILYRPHGIELRFLQATKTRALIIGGIAFVSTDGDSTTTAAATATALYTSVFDAHTSESISNRSLIDDLKTLQGMKDSGILTDEEFTIAKSRILNSNDRGNVYGPLPSSDTTDRDFRSPEAFPSEVQNTAHLLLHRQQGTEMVVMAEVIPMCDNSPQNITPAAAEALDNEATDSSPVVSLEEPISKMNQVV